MSFINDTSILHFCGLIFSKTEFSGILYHEGDSICKTSKSDLKDMNPHGLHSFHTVILVVGQLWHLYILLELDHWFNLG